MKKAQLSSRKDEDNLKPPVPKKKIDPAELEPQIELKEKPDAKEDKPQIGHEVEVSNKYEI